ncbi:hypothetical protein [Mycobacteroides chelonae]|uniref:DUF6414 family protein n=1 Tax=Mycobacteroides chelonae TaxID=1774 RepID=UPI001041D9DC|nr:hypothetical protein [Mycobacteroides chelonae]MBF9351699.1 hypothetical protein [Mycobacteroides chelonae]
MAVYKKPKSRVHRGFQYLDDETVVNSLSAVEAGKIDEVVAKIASAKEGGLGGGVGFSGVSVEGGRKSTRELEEEIVKVRTRFSIFELWYQNLRDKDAIGKFTGWGSNALEDIEIGDTFEIQAEIKIAPFQILSRLFQWYVDRASIPNTIFSTQGQELKELKKSARNMSTMLGEDMKDVFAKVTPVGLPGPAFYIQLRTDWIIGGLGDLSGTFTLIGQVDRILSKQESTPALRLTNEVPPTRLEISTLKEALKSFAESATEFELEWSDNEAEVIGPALVARPIAIYR